MKISRALRFIFGLVESAAAAMSFAGSNLYYAAGLTQSQQTALFTGLEDAGVQVLRVWLDGEFEPISTIRRCHVPVPRQTRSFWQFEGQSYPQKGTSINSYPYLEGSAPKTWNDEVLNRLDDFMYKARGYGIKLIVSFHSYNALEGKKDFYGQYYGTGDFYSSSEAISHYKDRIGHVMAHVNPHNGKPWSQSPEYIFAFETQNKAMHKNVW
jgi:mannan endo-1,4-beta-mannosidase